MNNFMSIHLLTYRKWGNPLKDTDYQSLLKKKCITQMVLYLNLGRTNFLSSMS